MADTSEHFRSRLVGRSGAEVVLDVVDGPNGVLGLSLVYGGAAFELIVDRQAKRVHWEGHDAVMTLERKELLEAMAKDMRPTWDSMVLPKHSEAAQRTTPVRAVTLMVAWLARAPAGLSLADREFPLATPSPRPPNNRDGASCDVVDDGVTVLTECCVQQGGRLHAVECHDATGHPGQATGVACGWMDPCDGRCGEHCKAFAVYTQDCLDHDSCTHHRVGHTSVPHDAAHLTNHPDCGNEYQHAIDDFFAINIVPFLYPPEAIWVIAHTCTDPPGTTPPPDLSPTATLPDMAPPGRDTTRRDMARPARRCPQDLDDAERERFEGCISTCVGNCPISERKAACVGHCTHSCCSRIH